MKWTMGYFAERLGLIFLTIGLYEATTAGLNNKVIVYIGIAVIALILYFGDLLKPGNLPSYNPTQKSATIQNTLLFIIKNQGLLDVTYYLYSTQGELLLSFDEDQLEIVLESYRKKNYTTLNCQSDMSNEIIVVLVWDAQTPLRDKENLIFRGPPPKFNA